MSKKFKVGDEVVWVGKHDNGAVGIVLNIDKGKYDVKWLSGCDVGIRHCLTDLLLEPYEEPSSNKNSPRPHAELIKAWADGAEIEVWNKYTQEWVYDYNPYWHQDVQYRVKLDTKEYRLAIVDSDMPRVMVCNKRENQSILEERPGFIRWLTDWTEYQP